MDDQDCHQSMTKSINARDIRSSRYLKDDVSHESREWHGDLR